MSTRKWEILPKSKNKDVIDVLLENRGLKGKKEKKEFLNPPHPEKISLKDLGIERGEVLRAVSRLRGAKAKKEKVIVYGDYDADGVSATAILWESLYAQGIDAMPYLPSRQKEGYGLNAESIKRLLEKYPHLGLIVTVDNGIVALGAVSAAKKLGIDVIITDHHEPGRKKPAALAIIHTKRLSGSGIAWFLTREMGKSNGLELAALGTVADQLPLLGANRSLVKFGLPALSQTTRPGLVALLEEAGISDQKINTYHIGFMIAPRINATGRMDEALDSLRLLCTKRTDNGRELAGKLGRANLLRQKTLEEMLFHAKESLRGVKEAKTIVIADASYHEGVIGLLAAKLTEEFYRPTIVLSKKEGISKASGRSIAGFNIIENIRKLEHLILEGGGHAMAAGFSIENPKVEAFREEFEKLAQEVLTEEILTRKLRIDLALPFSQITEALLEKISVFEPTGIGNPTPTFVTRGVAVLETRLVGQEGKHLKLKLGGDGRVLNAIGFGLGPLFSQLSPEKKVDIVYSLEEDTWGGRKSIQLKIRDLRIS